MDWTTAALADLQAKCQALSAPLRHLHTVLGQSEHSRMSSATLSVWRKAGDGAEHDDLSLNVLDKVPTTSLSAHTQVALKKGLDDTTPAAQALLNSMAALVDRLSQGPAYRATGFGAGLILIVRARADTLTVSARLIGCARPEGLHGNGPCRGIEDPLFAAQLTLAAHIDGVNTGPQWIVGLNHGDPGRHVQAKDAHTAIAWLACATNIRFLDDHPHLQVRQVVDNARQLVRDLLDRALPKDPV